LHSTIRRQREICIRDMYDVGKTFAENATQVHKKIARALKRNKVFVLQFLAELPMTLIDAVLLNTYNSYCNRLAEKTARVMSYCGKNKRELGVTNLTVLDIPTNYGNYEIKNMIFVPPAVSYCQNVIGVSTINGRMTIAYHNMKNL
ncbi:MAG: hypothetical protein K2G20_09905, partial [Lachnospiraceae bacterium]|nr:hypothetical protein [Lachnospiraceae bacterium]